MRRAEHERTAPVETVTGRLVDLLRALQGSQRVVEAALPTLRDLARSGDSDSLERWITERFASTLPALAALVEARESEVKRALDALSLPAEERKGLLSIRRAYVLYKSEIQAANLFEQGYLHRITGVRHRPYVFVYSGTPAVDLTFRSFDRNLLRVVDTLDNVMGLVAGLAEAIAAAYERSRVIGVKLPEQTAKGMLRHLTRVASALDQIKPIAEGDETTLGHQTTLEKKKGRKKQR